MKALVIFDPQIKDEINGASEAWYKFVRALKREPNLKTKNIFQTSCSCIFDLLSETETFASVISFAAREGVPYTVRYIVDSDRSYLFTPIDGGL